MTAKDYLYQLKSIDRLIDSLNVQLSDVTDVRASSSGRMPDVPIRGKGGTTDPTYNIVIEEERLILEIKNQRQKYMQIKADATRLIGMVDNHQYQTLLYQYYCKNRTLEETAEYIGKSYQTICKWHGNALKEIQEIMDREGIT